ncbi:hemerythrin domain-containing protein [Microbulbifer sp. 2201CG32-9]|uniref:hemerythrin domain-containing protein n=1 Tax=unclassified Microbulbifer TaxID=2619833 RepID=UPI00345B9B86
MFRIFSNKSRHDDDSRRDRDSRDTSSGSTGRTISYDPSLITDLKRDHHDLVDAFQRIWSEGYEKRDFRHLSQLLTAFKSSFQAHLIKENVRFYVYLEQALAGDIHTLQIVKDFRTDMNDIANAVVQFCKRYNHEAFSQEMIRDFKLDYDKIGEALVRRVTLEEKELYTLYQPS